MWMESGMAPPWAMEMPKRPFSQVLFALCRGLNLCRVVHSGSTIEWINLETQSRQQHPTSRNRIPDPFIGNRAARPPSPMYGNQIGIGRREDRGVYSEHERAYKRTYSEREPIQDKQKERNPSFLPRNPDLPRKRSRVESPFTKPSSERRSQSPNDDESHRSPSPTRSNSPTSPIRSRQSQLAEDEREADHRDSSPPAFRSHVLTTRRHDKLSPHQSCHDGDESTARFSDEGIARIEFKANAHQLAPVNRRPPTSPIYVNPFLSDR